MSPAWLVVARRRRRGNASIVTELPKSCTRFREGQLGLLQGDDGVLRLAGQGLLRPVGHGRLLREEDDLSRRTPRGSSPCWRRISRRGGDAMARAERSASSPATRESGSRRYDADRQTSGFAPRWPRDRGGGLHRLVQLDPPARLMRRQPTPGASSASASTPSAPRKPRPCASGTTPTPCAVTASYTSSTRTTSQRPCPSPSPYSAHSRHAAAPEPAARSC